VKAITSRRFILSTAAILALFFTSLTAFAADRQLVRTARANYPEMAKRMHVSGSVTLGVHIAADGSVGKVDVIGGHPLLTQAAVESVKQWKYQPGPEETRKVSVDFTF
jgi:TonB family protein